jgi:gamma-glutamyltranspeptidase/glutathione hydrolase
MAATSHPLATWAALRALEDGGTACDAAVAAAAVLCVCEPMSTGIGGDAFAIVWRDGRLDGLNASGPAGAASAEALAAAGAIPIRGPLAVTVPGAVAGWAALLERHGRLGLGRCLAPAVELAERGFAVTPVIARAWAGLAPWLEGEAAVLYGRAPAVGETARFPELAATLRRIATDGPDAFYRGAVAEAICEVTALEESDLAGFDPQWVTPLRAAWRGVEVCELPPNGQGATVLAALGLAERLEAATPADRVHAQAEALKLAMAEAQRIIGDAPLPGWYLDPGSLAERAAGLQPGQAGDPECAELPYGGTVYLCVVDEERTACSFIQSLFWGFGSLLAAPGTGVMLQNRGAGFTLEAGHPNEVAPGRRPFHTIIPGMLLRDGELLGPFGLMGGHMQAQGHVQLLSGLVEQGLDPQAALAAPRFRLDHLAGGWVLALEPGLAPLADDLAARGHRVQVEDEPGPFGGGQVVLRAGEALVGGSEPRKDGHAAGL